MTKVRQNWGYLCKLPIEPILTVCHRHIRTPVPVYVHVVVASSVADERAAEEKRGEETRTSDGLLGSVCRKDFEFMQNFVNHCPQVSSVSVQQCEAPAVWEQTHRTEAKVSPASHFSTLKKCFALYICFDEVGAHLETVRCICTPEMTSPCLFRTCVKNAGVNPPLDF